MKTKLFQRTLTKFFRTAIPFTAVVLAIPAFAQSVSFKAPRDRVTVPLNFSGSITVTNLVTVTSVGSPVNLTVSGLPAGATYALTDTNGSPLLSTSATIPLWLTLNLTNVARGSYVFSLNGAGGAVNNLLFTLQAGHLWNGSTNALIDGPGNWSDSTKWLGGSAPGAGDEVVFNDTGGQTNALSGGAYLVNSIVDQNTTIASLRFAQATNGTSFHTLQINPGKTLSIVGTNGFSFQREYIADTGFGAIVNTMFTTVLGSNATLVVSNSSANFAMLNDGSGNNAFANLDLSQLDTLRVDVRRMGLGDYLL